MPQGGSATFAPTGSETPDSGHQWDIKDPSGAVIAHEKHPHGWSVSWSGSEFTVGAPSSAPVGQGYKVRYKPAGEEAAFARVNSPFGIGSEADSEKIQAGGSSAGFGVTSGGNGGGLQIYLTATAGNGQVALNWNATATSTFSVYETTANGQSGTLLATTSANSYTVRGLANGTICYFVIEAQTEQTVAESNVAGATPLGPPSALTATAGVGQVSLNWSAGAGDATYNVYDSTTSGGPYTQVASGVTATNYTVTGLTNGTTYYFVVSSWNVSTTNNAGTGGNSNQAGATPGVPIPANLTATAGNQLVSLSWGAVPGATYNVQRSTTSGSGYTTIASGVVLTIYGDNTAVNGATYYYAVSATENGVTGGNSNQASASPFANTDILTAVGAGTQINLTWTPAPGAGSYTVSRSLSPYGFQPIATLASTATTFSDISVNPNQDYWYQLTANNSTGTPYNTAEASTASNIAGFYSVTYGGGTSNNGTPWQLGMFNNGNNQNPGINIPSIACWSGGSSSPDGGQCAGPISAYFTWIGAGDPPQQVQVSVYTVELAGCDALDYLDADDGLGFAENGTYTSQILEVGSTPGQFGQPSMHTYYLQNPGATFTIPDAMPIASAGAADSTNGWFNATYAAYAAPVNAPTISLAGQNPTSNSIMVGQQLTVNINLTGTGLTSSAQDSFTWTVAGAGAVGGYTMNANAGTITPLTASVPAPGTGTYLTQSQLACFLTQASQTGSTQVTVGCTYTNAKSGLTFRDLVPVTLSVVAPQDIPEPGMFSNVGSMQLVTGSGASIAPASGSTATGMVLYGSTLTAGGSTYTSGIYICDEVKDPGWLNATGQDGTWVYVQTVDGLQSSDSWVPPGTTTPVARIFFKANTYGPITTLDGLPVAGAGSGQFPMFNLFPSNVFPFSAAPTEPGSTEPELGGMVDGPGAGQFAAGDILVDGETIVFQGTFHSFVVYQAPPNQSGATSIQVPIVRYDWTINPTSTTYSASSASWSAPATSPAGGNTVTLWTGAPDNSTTFPIPVWSLPPPTLTASAAGVSPVTLTWQVAAGANPGDFQVYRGVSLEPYTLLSNAQPGGGLSIANGVATYTDPSAAHGTGPYYYFVLGKSGYVGYTQGTSGLPVIANP